MTLEQAKASLFFAPETKNLADWFSMYWQELFRHNEYTYCPPQHGIIAMSSIEVKKGLHARYSEDSLTELR